MAAFTSENGQERCAPWPTGRGISEAHCSAVRGTARVRVSARLLASFRHWGHVLVLDFEECVLKRI